MRRLRSKKAMLLAAFFAFLMISGVSVSVVVTQAQEEEAAAPQENWPSEATPEQLEEGEAIYFVKCVWCHGVEGAGDGPSADRLWPRPRNFNQGTFKIRHTASGELPLDEDLFQTITHGLPGSAMPAWEHVLTPQKRRAVMQFVKTELVKDRDFQDKEFEEYNVIDFGTQIPSSEESIAQGREVYEKKAKCVECHGVDGRGNGNLTQNDEWDFPIVPANLHKCWNFRGNRGDPYNPRNIFREVTTGLNGTPMPSFSDILTEEERWHVANFVISLCPKRNIDPITMKPTMNFVIRSHFVEGELPATADDPAWEEIEPTYVGLGSQITHKPRNFVRLVDEVWVRSVYNENEIAYWFEWSDRTESHMDEAAKKLGEGNIPEVPPSGEPVAMKAIRNWPVYNDAIAVQFPSKWQEIAPPEKPRFIFGDKKNSVDLWKWESDGEVKEYTGEGWDNLKFRDQEGVTVPQAVWKDGVWRVVMKRSRVTDNKSGVEAQFTDTGKYIPMVFFAWDGHNGDTGRKMSISTWWYTILIPPTPMQVYVLPPIVALVILGVQFWLKGKVEKANGKKK